MKILIINGPNLNRLGKRDPGVYGRKTLAEINEELRQSFPQLEFTFLQSNHEGALIDAIQQAEAEYQGIVINPGAYSHYSLAIRDAIADCPIPVVEVHISNIAAREEFRRHSVISAVCQGTVAGFGPNGYALAVRGLLSQIKTKKV
ncbi:MAG TPA: type II 3-dehydroquinate dehydratase [Caldithrix abyssi]|uniref:3-dehydroquinate dehydratase n=1 Tax=Caldithrix abyssi TaxID=187145 RepID=A0A7V4UDP6_CALAY|nr:type II 3-dehydroquinate dehydratase [Caldithrix abyssi]